ncbi:MAG: hypothetical protein ACOYIG_08655, partial [Acetivibrionales bacterium]
MGNNRLASHVVNADRRLAENLSVKVPDELRVIAILGFVIALVLTENHPPIIKLITRYNLSGLGFLDNVAVSVIKGFTDNEIVGIGVFGSIALGRLYSQSTAIANLLLPPAVGIVRLNQLALIVVFKRGYQGK